MPKRKSSPSVEQLQEQLKSIKKHISDKLKEAELEEEEQEETISKDGSDLETSSKDGDGSGASDDDDDLEIDDKENEGKKAELSGGNTEEPAEHQFPELDEETLKLLDDDEDANKANKFVFHPKLASSWTKIIENGLSKEKKKILLDKYPLSGNCPILTPKLNIEVEAILSDANKKRDKFFSSDLDLCGASLSALGLGISMIFNSATEAVDTTQLLTTLIDSGKLMCELRSQLIKARKAFVFPSVDKKIKTVLEKAETGEFLFGPDLTSKIKSAKAVEKLGLSIKPTVVDKKPTFSASSTLNWRGSSARGRGSSSRGSFQKGRSQYGHSRGRQPFQERPQQNQTLSSTATANNQKK